MPRNLATARQIAANRVPAIGRALSTNRTIVSELLWSLVAYWNLNEASGTRADATGRGNDLADNFTVTQNPGIIASAAQFTAANTEYLSRADNADLSMGDIDFTLACWAYFDTAPGAGAARTLISKYLVTGNHREYSITWENGTGRITFYVSPDGTTSTNIKANALGIPATATWYFIVAWHDSVADTINIQVNNGAVDSASHITGVINDTSAFNLGSLNQLANYYQNGRIDEVGIWKRVLSATERAALYNGAAGRTYPFAGA